MRVALIGGGPSAVAVFIGLSQSLAGLVKEVVVYDKNGILTSDFTASSKNCYLTNTSAGITSIVPGQEGDFTKWLSFHLGHPTNPEAFVPRVVYKEYVLQRFSEARTRFRLYGTDCKISIEHVTGLIKADEGTVSVKTKHKTQNFDVAIIATGALHRKAIPAFVGNDKYVDNIYKNDAWHTRLPGSGNVLLLGSKLAAIDATILLRRERPDIHIVMASRSGELPSVRSELIRYDLPNFDTKVNALPSGQGKMRAVFTLAARDLRELAEGHETLEKAENPLDQLSVDIAACKSGKNRWQYAIGHFIEEMNRVWPHLSTAEQVSFKKKYGGFISRYVSSFPLQNAIVLDEAIAAGKLTIVSTGDMQSVVRTIGNDMVGFGRLATWRFDAVVNCTGLDVKENRAEPIGQSLEAIGCTYNIHGGLTVDTATMRLHTINGDLQLYAIGAPVSGSLLVTNYVRASVQQAEIIVTDLKERVAPQQLHHTAA